MAIFCTKCGVSNEDGGAFCDNCGAKLRAASDGMEAFNSKTPSSTSPPRIPVYSKTGVINPKKMVYAGGALAAILVLGCGAIYFVLQPPAATAKTLLAAAKAGYGKETSNRFKQELCISNIDYSQSTFNAGENDQSTKAWMNAMVAAGLYKPPVAISSGGLFEQTLHQYVATPELEKFRENKKLCVAKDVEISEVTDIKKPEEEFLGRNGGPPKVLVVEAKLLLKSLNTAPWMENSQVRDAVIANINGWEYKDKIFQKKIPDSFGLKENKWTTGSAYKEELEQQYRNAQRSNSSDNLEEDNTAGESVASGLGFRLSGLFTFGHPLKGTWRTAASTGGVLGNLPAGVGPTLTFTADSMESMGHSTSVAFSVDGKLVKVTPKGQSSSLVFVMENSDTMVAQALGGMRYERVK